VAAWRVSFVANLLQEPATLRQLDAIHRLRWWLRAVATVFLIAWVVFGYYDLGWRATGGQYIMLTRGLIYVMHYPSIWGIGPFWQHDWVFTFRPHSDGPSLSIEPDTCTDANGLGIPLLYFAFLLVLLSEFPSLLSRIPHKRRFPHGRCHTCGYSLDGLKQSKCPECGSQDAAK